MTTYKVQLDNTNQIELEKIQLIEILAAFVLQLANPDNVPQNLLMTINITNDNGASN